MSPSLSLFFYLKSLSSPPVSPSEQVHIPVVFDPPVMSSVREDSPSPPPLQVYRRRQSSHRPQDYSLLVSNPSSFQLR